jgi:hypothetical protein
MSEQDDDLEIARAMRAFKHPRRHALLIRLRAFFTRSMLCSVCDHFFDPRDKRSYIDPAIPHCPACATSLLRGDMQWAVWNDCQGIFECRPRRADANELIAQYDAGCEIRPVRVYLEPDDRIAMREWLENELQS